MKKFFFILTIPLIAFFLSSYTNNIVIKPIVLAKATPAKIKMTIDNQEIIVQLNNSSASKDFLTLLPLSLTFKDYVQKEKIASLPRRLVNSHTPTTTSQTADFTYYAPWGNLAVFYKDKQQEGNGLVILGTIESGKNILSNLNSDFTATIEQIQ